MRDTEKIIKGLRNGSITPEDIGLEEFSVERAIRLLKEEEEDQEDPKAFVEEMKEMYDEEAKKG